MSNHIIQGKFDPTMLEQHRSSILRIKITICLQIKKSKFLGFFDKILSDYNIAFSNETIQLVENVVETGFLDGSMTLGSYKSKNIKKIMNYIFDSSLFWEINNSFLTKKFNKVTIFDLELKIFDQVIIYRNFNLPKKDILELLKDCKKILTQLDKDKTPEGLNKCIEEVKDNFQLSISSKDSNHESKQDSEFKANNPVILFSCNKQSSNELPANSPSHKIKAKTNTL